MGKAAEILDIDDIKNLTDIYGMFVIIISRCNLSNEERQVVQKTCNNLKMLLADLS